MLRYTTSPPPLKADISHQGMLNDVGGTTIAAFDNTGQVFAVACSDTQTIMLFGTNTMDSVGPAFIHLGTL